MGGENYGITVLHLPKASDGVSPAQRTVFDLVAVHGLNGHALTTWTHKKSRVNWLRDLLPQSLPNVRVMTYGYNAKFKNFTGDQDLRDIASKLLAELVDHRRTTEEKARPVVFVSHSLGGIVTKKALLIGCPKEQQQIQAAVYGIMFLATPHNGSSIANVGSILGNIVSACSSLNPARGLLGTLKQDSKALFEITADFLHRMPKLQLVSFYETESTPLGLSKKMASRVPISQCNLLTDSQIVERGSAILGLPNEITIPQNSDHREIARFQSAEDENYHPVATRLAIFHDDIACRAAQPSMRQVTLDSTQSRQITGIFEISISTCRIFHGREKLLTDIDNWFSGSSFQRKQKSFAICGLGGSGKTQAAIQFALGHRRKYNSAVIVFNASSSATLLADFERIHELLKLPQSSNTVHTVKSWLSEEVNSDWLLIFDNADDLKEVNISRFLPATEWGDIIFTSRDCAAIGTVAQQGHIMENLTVGEAILTLKDASGIESLTEQDEVLAETIVKTLGCLPLAVDQAGAFIRTRQRTFADYIRLFENQQRELLRFCPRLGDNDKAVLTAWELNFRQVEKEDDKAKRLLMVCSFLDPANISEQFLRRGCTARRRWSAEGERVEVPPNGIPRDEYLIDTVSNELAHDDAIEKLLSFSLVRRNNNDNQGGRSILLHPLVQYAATQRLTVEEQDSWRLQAVLLVCHAFPVGRDLEAKYSATGRPLMPHVRRALIELDEYTKRNALTKDIRRKVIGLLVSASLFGDTKWKKMALKRAKDFAKHETDRSLLAEIAQRESAMLRMYQDRPGSTKILETFLLNVKEDDSKAIHELSPLWNAHYAAILVSYSRNLTYDGETIKAALELQSWQPLNPQHPSTMELLARFRRDTALIRILREEGMFLKALQCLQAVLHQNPEDSNFDEISIWQRGQHPTVADLYCELGQPREADAALRGELDQLKQRGEQNIRTGRFIQLSMAESYILREMWSEAEELLQNLERVFTIVKDPDLITQTGLFRVWFAYARLAHMQGHWREAYAYWHKCLDVAQKCDFKDYPQNIVYLSLAHVSRMMGNVEEANAFERQANESLARTTMKYFIVGLGTYWLDYIRNHTRQPSLVDSGYSALSLRTMSARGQEDGENLGLRHPDAGTGQGNELVTRLQEGTKDLGRIKKPVGAATE